MSPGVRLRGAPSSYESLRTYQRLQSVGQPCRRPPTSAHRTTSRRHSATRCSHRRRTPLAVCPGLLLGAAHLSLQHYLEAHYSFTRAHQLEGAPVRFPTAGAAAYVAEVLRLQGRLEDARRCALDGLESAERSDHAYRDFFERMRPWTNRAGPGRARRRACRIPAGARSGTRPSTDSILRSARRSGAGGDRACERDIRAGH